MAKKAFEGLTESMYYILMAFLNQEVCGTEITEFVDRKTFGRVKIGPGTLYTILSRYEAEGIIVETAVDGRKRTYRITEKGRELYQSELARLKACVLDGESEGIL